MLYISKHQMISLESEEICYYVECVLPVNGFLLIVFRSASLDLDQDGFCP